VPSSLLRCDFVFEIPLPPLRVSAPPDWITSHVFAQEWYGRSITSPNGMAARTPEPLASLPSLCPSPDDGPPVHASSGGRQQGGAALVERPTALRERPRDEDALSNASSEQDGPAEWSDAQIVNSIYRPTNGGGHSRPQPSRLNGDSPPLGHSRSGPEMDYHRRNESRDLIDLRSPAASMPFGQFQERAPPHAQGAENPGFQPTVRPLSPLPNRSPSHGRPRGQQVASPTSLQPPPPNQHPTTMDAPPIVEHAESGHLVCPLLGCLFSPSSKASAARCCLCLKPL
jgi:hypothetical protein